MLPEIWGRYAWKFIHLVTLGYPEKPTDADKKRYYDFFQDLQYVLPCKKCRHNMTDHLKKYPLTSQALSSRTSLVKWGIDLHNIVNYYTGKPMLTYPEALHEINKLAHPKKNNDLLYYLLVIMALIILVYLIYYYYKRI